MSSVRQLIAPALSVDLDGGGMPPWGQCVSTVTSSIAGKREGVTGCQTVKPQEVGSD